MTYQPRRPAWLESLQIRGLNFQLYRFAGADPRPVVLLHGWGDSGATWQFVIDHLSMQRTLVAFDARGFGRTQWSRDGYWFPDYLADLDAILERLAPDTPVDLVGHSMGGNVAMLYAGVRSQRVRKLISLEGFGMARTTPELAPARYRQWLEQLRQGVEFSTFGSFEKLVEVLARRNPRTPLERLEFIARAWGVERADGRVELRADAGHKRVNAMLYQRDQVEACWKEITAPLLLVAGDQSEFAQRMNTGVDGNPGPDAGQRSTLFHDARWATVADAGHMLHHEQPQAVAQLIDAFLG